LLPRPGPLPLTVGFVTTKRLRTPVTFDDACAQIEGALHGSTRRAIVDDALRGGDGAPAFEAMQSAMRANTFPTASGPLVLRRIVDSFDAKSRREGLHVVQGWDFQNLRFTTDNSPSLLVEYCSRLSRTLDDRASLTILLDQYFLTVLSLLAVRAWDDGDANANLDRLTSLVRAVQGPGGSGRMFVEDAETLLFLAVSYYHPNEDSYGRLLEKVRRLNDAHRLRIAIPCAAMLGSHLRWGLRFMYDRDVGRMRDDNLVDYPWLLFAAVELLRAGAYEPLLDALSADPWAFTGDVPAALVVDTQQHSAFRLRLGDRGAGLLAEFEKLQPAPRSYSPLSYACNFPSNASVASVAVSLEDGTVFPALSALFARKGGDPALALAERLMKYSASDPSRLGAGGAPLIVYDPADGAHAFNATMRTLKEFHAKSP
jgi:hypothetical protein